MIVVADTPPVNYLVLIGEADLLHRLYGRVLIPPAVLAELQHPETPPAVIAWVTRAPTWLEVRSLAVPSGENDEALDAGEREAIALAEEHKPDVLLLIDEEQGRVVARQRNIPTTGTLGVLDDAAARGLVDLRQAIERLKETNFWAADSLLDWLMLRDQQRKLGHKS